MKNALTNALTNTITAIRPTQLLAALGFFGGGLFFLTEDFISQGGEINIGPLFINGKKSQFVENSSASEYTEFDQDEDKEAP